jgi:hypothetical protein
VRLDDAVIARIDAFIPLLSELWRDASRSDVLREIIALGLDHFERDPQGALRELARPKMSESEPE